MSMTMTKETYNSKDLKVLVTVNHRKPKAKVYTPTRDLGKWSCNKCGSCCRIIGCKHLTKSNTCEIYETRPLICHVTTDQTVYCQQCRHLVRRKRKSLENIKKRSIEELCSILEKGKPLE